MLYLAPSHAIGSEATMPETHHLYHHDPYRTQFDATVTERLELNGQLAVVLDTTCFYPTSGGQPHDTGTLDGVRVVDVVEEDGRIIHVLAKELPPGPVHGTIDWGRRFDHMQQHTGQHILSRAFEDLFDAATVSFHLGAGLSTIDVDLPSLDWEAATQVEELSNRVVLDNRRVTTEEYDRDEIGGLNLRKAPPGRGRLRVVSIEGFDDCACGGTHLRATGEVGSIHIHRWERQRKRIRAEFLCGWRALRHHRATNLTCQRLGLLLSTGVEDLPDAVERLFQAEDVARRRVRDLQERLLALELPHLASQAEPVGGLAVVVRLLEGYNAANMRHLAQGLTQKAGMVALLAVTDPSPQLCFARSQDVDLDMAQVLRESAHAYGGRGGGRPHVAQGGGMSAEDLPLVLAEARRRIGAG